MKHILLAATLLFGAAWSAHAAELSPLQGKICILDGGASALVYFESKPDGYHVVTTVQSDATAAAKVFRFTAVLAAGQSTEISVPGELGRPTDAVVIRRIGDLLVMDGSGMRGRS